MGGSGLGSFGSGGNGRSFGGEDIETESGRKRRGQQASSQPAEGGPGRQGSSSDCWPCVWRAASVGSWSGWGLRGQQAADPTWPHRWLKSGCLISSSVQRQDKACLEIRHNDAASKLRLSMCKDSLNERKINKRIDAPGSENVPCFVLFYFILYILMYFIFKLWFWLLLHEKSPPLRFIFTKSPSYGHVNEVWCCGAAWNQRKG